MKYYLKESPDLISRRNYEGNYGKFSERLPEGISVKKSWRKFWKQAFLKEIWDFCWILVEFSNQYRKQIYVWIFQYVSVIPRKKYLKKRGVFFIYLCRNSKFIFLIKNEELSEVIRARLPVELFVKFLGNIFWNFRRIIGEQFLNQIHP